MEVLIENIIIYSTVAILFLSILFIYLRKQKRESNIVEEKIRIAKEEGLYEPVSLHPVVDINKCIKSGACYRACPEKDILGVVNGKATVINASNCIGHGACFHACPTEAISLCIGTEKRGVDLPHINHTFETNVSGVYIAGELGGMGLIRNAVEQGKQAVENIAKNLQKGNTAEYDLLIVGSGPSGISASLAAKKLNLKSITLEQDSLGGTVYTFPRSKIVMTSPMDLPLHGKIKLYETNKSELLGLWEKVLSKYNINIKENSKVESIDNKGDHFIVSTNSDQKYSAKAVLLAIGRRGSPRKLMIPGENMEKVSYRLLEPELINDNNIVIVGGGDSAIEAALLLMHKNKVCLSYRKDAFSRIKPKNRVKINEAIEQNLLDIQLNSNLESIHEDYVIIKKEESEVKIENDQVFIFAGGELPTQFLQKIGIQITRKFGEAILKH